MTLVCRTAFKQHRLRCASPHVASSRARRYCHAIASSRCWRCRRRPIRGQCCRRRDIAVGPPHARGSAHAAGARAETAEPADDALAISNWKVAAHCRGQAPEAGRTGPDASSAAEPMHVAARTAGSTDAVRAIPVPGYAVSNACDEQGKALTSASSSLSRLRLVDLPASVLHPIFNAVDDGTEMGRGAKSRARDILACVCTELYSFYRTEYVAKVHVVP
jgi:hypothetical protein